MKNELIKIDETPLPKQMRDSHIPQVGDIYIYNYDHSIIRVLSKVDGYNRYHYEEWSFSQNRWIPSESTTSIDSSYYTLLLHPFEEVLKMCNECFDNPNFLQQLNCQDKDSTSLITQGDKLVFMLEESQLLQDKMESVQSLMRGRVKEMERMMRNTMMDKLAENICNNNNVMIFTTSVERDALTRLLDDMDVLYDTYVDKIGLYNVIFEKRWE